MIFLQESQFESENRRNLYGVNIPSFNQLYQGSCFLYFPKEHTSMESFFQDPDFGTQLRPGFTITLLLK